jgi:hypothetical protein
MGVLHIDDGGQASLLRDHRAVGHQPPNSSTMPIAMARLGRISYL